MKHKRLSLTGAYNEDCVEFGHGEPVDGKYCSLIVKPDGDLYVKMWNRGKTSYEDLWVDDEELLYLLRRLHKRLRKRAGVSHYEG